VFNAVTVVSENARCTTRPCSTTRMHPVKTRDKHTPQNKSAHCMRCTQDRVRRRECTRSKLRETHSSKQSQLIVGCFEIGNIVELSRLSFALLWAQTLLGKLCKWLRHPPNRFPRVSPLVTKVNEGCKPGGLQREGRLCEKPLSRVSRIFSNRPPPKQASTLWQGL